MVEIKVCVGALVRRGEEFLLVRRKNPPEQGLWALPGGKVEPGEGLKEAVKREVREETSIEVEVEDVVYVFEIMQREKGILKEHFVIIDFMAHYVSGEVHPGDDAMDARWVHVEGLAGLPLSQYTRRFFEEKLYVTPLQTQGGSNH